MFLTQGTNPSVSTAVHIRLDCSGSMAGPKMELASQACFSVASALSQCRGVNVGVTAFPALAKDDRSTVYPILRHGERMHVRFHLTAQGYTPLAETLW